MTTVGLPGADRGLQKEDKTIAEFRKPHSRACGQLGRNYPGDLYRYLQTAHGFDVKKSGSRQDRLSRPPGSARHSG
ncbi:MAG: hypothetical protein JOZ42_13930 [Acetobacteraceae bacterium]|nr:hypothetical protein [Acetobacteraceae bacterium]